MPRICDLTGENKQKVIKLYNQAFKEQPVPCGTDKCFHGRYNPSGCCGSCGPMLGYLPEPVFNVLKSEYKWTKKHGFLKPGVGCKLPMEQRSATCVGFTCLGMSTEQREAGNQIWKALT